MWTSAPPPISAAPVVYGETVTLNPDAAIADGSFQTTSPSARANVDLVFDATLAASA